MTCISAMLQLEVPHINILTKMDLCEDTTRIERFLSSDSSLLLEDANIQMSPKFKDLNAALVRLV